ncbi:hypothetical protein Flexsi_0892 [Flexistipes sinusarabici DSM 4947]|uniref:Uncharacterized protein n=1 Tax=Flexistipes sinusarabici (strain ATCC 49648 / DSM 4947 / MAS 10) TaxID=717231 RepID=F8E4Y4_FLESM|nr:hypothetical protein [Flexistipes sinusarabici]AEI14554.1 hypothetical protein Flexsi_0892 [Flexistipes sinusarabici DSM 4947]
MKNKRYIKITGALIVCYVLFMIFDGVLNYISYPFLIYFALEHEVDSENLIPHAFLLGMFNDFITFGIFGISVLSIILFYFTKRLLITLFDYNNLLIKLLYSFLSYTIFVVIAFSFTDYSFANDSNLLLIPLVVNSSLYFVLLSLKDFGYAFSLS